MDVGIRGRGLVVFFTFFWVLAANNSQRIRHFTDILPQKAIPHFDQDKVEEVWIRCTRELIESTRGNVNLIFYLSQAASKNENLKLDRPQRIKTVMQKTITVLPRQERHLLLECLRAEAELLDESKTWISRCQKLLSSQSTVPRRCLRGRKLQNSAVNPLPTQGPASSPSPFPRAVNPPASQGPAAAPSTTTSASQLLNHLDPPLLQGPSAAPTSSNSQFLSQIKVADLSPLQGPSAAPTPAPLHGAPASSPSPSPNSIPHSPVSSPAVTTAPVPAPSKGSNSSPPKIVADPVPAPSKGSNSSPPKIVAAPVPAPPKGSNHSPPTAVAAPVPAPPKGSIRSPPKAVANPPPRARPAAVTTSGSNQAYDHYIIALSAIGFVASLTLVAVLLFCVVNQREISPPIEGQTEEGRDEKPLLRFCSSDVSAASSQQPCIGKPGDKNSKTSSAIGSEASGGIHNSSKVETQSSEAAGNGASLLPLPPGKSAPPPPPAPSAPPPPPPKPPAPRAPPPPKPRPPNPPKPGKIGASALGPHHKGNSSIGEGSDNDDPDAPKTKLKPFFWDKVQANPDHSMVWHDIKAGSFQFNEEMMESLFGYVPTDKGKNENKKDSSTQPAPTQIRIIDSKKAQNLAILLKALNVTTEEVCDALREGNELPFELMHTLIKMAPTTDEELKLRLFTGDVTLLGPAERFLKVMVEIPFAFKRLEALLFMCSLREEASSVTESFTLCYQLLLGVACTELKSSRLFLKLLEAVLKTGNRMNDGTYRGGAQAFKLDTLLKLSDVKGTDGKTTLLLFVVQEIIRSEGVRAARKLRESKNKSGSMSSLKAEDLAEDSSQEETEEYHRNLGLQVVSGLSSELQNVKKAAVVDGDIITGTVSKLGQSLLKNKEFLNNELKSGDEEDEFCQKLATFLEQAEADITKLLEEEKRIMDLVRSTGDYFHGSSGKDEGLRLFNIVRDLLIMLDKVCREVKSSGEKRSSKTTTTRKELVPGETPRKESVPDSPQESHPDTSLPDVRQKLFPAIKDRRMEDSSSDDGSLSP